MNRPFLRPSEQRRDEHGTPGVCVRTADGRRFFFAGGTEQCGLALARASLGESLNDESTRVEWGFQQGKSWSCQRVVAPGTSGLTCEEL